MEKTKGEMMAFNSTTIKNAFNKAVAAHEESGKQKNMVSPRIVSIKAKKTPDGDLWAITYEDRDYVPVIDADGVESVVHSYSMRVFLLTGDVSLIYVPSSLMDAPKTTRGQARAVLPPGASFLIQMAVAYLLTTIKNTKKKKQVEGIYEEIHGAGVMGFGTALCEEATGK